MNFDSTQLDNIIDYRYSQSDLEVEDIILEVCNYMKNVKPEIIKYEIRRAYLYARKAHEWQTRKSGEPYIIHPVRALKELLLLKPDIVTIQACLLHDVAEDTEKTIEDILYVFWKDVAYIASGVEKLSQVKYRKKDKNDDLEVMSLRKMFIAMWEDLRVIFVKLADRIHNMKTIEFHPVQEKRERIALETLNIYAPIADRLWISEYKDILETECFKVLQKDEYEGIQKELDSIRLQQKLFLSKVREEVAAIIPKHIKVYDVGYRIKTPYSIYKKLQKTWYERVLDLYDLFAIRIIVDTIPHCYEILGEVHNKWSPLPKRFKDYVALPKENWYQSLHTTVVWFFNEIDRSSNIAKQPTEIQIRTKSMHTQAEIWVAAHFTYSESWHSTVSTDYWWVSELKEILNQSGDWGDFMKEMKVSIFSDRIFVFTPRWDVKNLPKWSTPIDFAYAIHSDIGNHIAIAKVNWKIVPLDYELKNGDNVEIIIDKNRIPNITWLSFTKTSKAKSHIQNFINVDNRSILMEKGKMILNSYLEKNIWKTLDKEMSILSNMDWRTLDTKAKEDILVQLGNLSMRPGSLLKHFIPSFKQPVLKILKDSLENTDTENKNQERGIIIWWEKDIPYRIALCCNPKEGDRIVGYNTRNGINIHKFDCASLKKWDPDKTLVARWLSQIADKWLTLKFQMSFHERIWIVKEITSIFFKLEAQIEEMSVKNNNWIIDCDFTIKIEDEDYYIYEKIVEKVKSIMKWFIESKLIEIR